MVKRPGNKRIVVCKYKIKEHITATKPKRFKVRLVDKGYT